MVLSSLFVLFFYNQKSIISDIIFNDYYVKYFCNCSIQTLQNNYTFEEFMKIYNNNRFQGKNPQDDLKFLEVLEKTERCIEEALQ